jgi:hypothetical protein
MEKTQKTQTKLKQSAAVFLHSSRRSGRSCGARSAATCAAVCSPAQTHLCLRFPYVCPEPIKWRQNAFSLQRHVSPAGVLTATEAIYHVDEPLTAVFFVARGSVQLQPVRDLPGTAHLMLVPSLS